MISELGAWFIFLLPFGSFVAIVLVIRPFYNRYAQLAGYLTVLV